MATRRKFKPQATEVGTEIRHKYSPGDHIAGDKWKDLYTISDPPITVTMDPGTFQWLWDFVNRKGEKADRPENQHYGPILIGTYKRAANQFAIAAQEAFGDTYKVDQQSQTTAESPTEAPVVAPKRRRKRKPPADTAKSFAASESLIDPDRKPSAQKPRSKRLRRSKTG